MNDILKEVEQLFNFQYLSLYYQLAEDGMLDIGEYHENWAEVILPTLEKNPPLLLYSFDFEVLNPNQILENIEEFFITNDDFNIFDIRPDLTFIPFAQTGGGDFYCFFLNEQAGEDIPIVLLYHDQDEGIYLAKNLQDFIFKMLLQDMVIQEFCADYAPDDERFIQKLTNIFKTHLCYLTASQQSVLNKVFAKGIQHKMVGTEKHRGFLTNGEYLTLIHQYIAYDKLDQDLHYRKSL